MPLLSCMKEVRGKYFLITMQLCCTKPKALFQTLTRSNYLDKPHKPCTNYNVNIYDFFFNFCYFKELFKIVPYIYLVIFICLYPRYTEGVAQNNKILTRY